MKKLLISAPTIALCAIAAVLSWNYTSIQRPLNAAAANDARNSGITAKAHFGSYIKADELVFDLRAIGPDKSPADVFRLFMQFSEQLKGRNFTRVVLAHKGTAKFQMKGDYFQQLGREYSIQNPVYTMRTFPEHLYRLDGSQAFGQWTGGWLGVLGKQMEEFTEFHKQWYINDEGSGAT